MSQRTPKPYTARAGLKWVAEHLTKALTDDEMLKAVCKQRPELPWTADVKPAQPNLRHMESCCSECPVFNRCAVMGVDALGGMYAGVWLPWKDEKGSPGVRTARREIRVRAGLPVGV